MSDPIVCKLRENCIYVVKTTFVLRINTYLIQSSHTLILYYEFMLPNTTNKKCSTQLHCICALYINALFPAIIICDVWCGECVAAWQVKCIASFLLCLRLSFAYTACDLFWFCKYKTRAFTHTSPIPPLTAFGVAALCIWLSFLYICVRSFSLLSLCLCGLLCCPRASHNTK